MSIATCSTVDEQELHVDPDNDSGIDLFALDEPSPARAATMNSRTYDKLDEAIDDAWCHNKDMCSVTHVRTHNNPAKRRRVSADDPDLRPIAFVRLNTRKGKPKPITVRALLDSGGGGCLVDEKRVQRLNVRKTKASQVWTTPNGNLSASSKVKTTFTMPELHDN